MDNNPDDPLIETKLEFPNLAIAENDNQDSCENSKNTNLNDETVVKMLVLLITFGIDWKYIFNKFIL